MEIIHCYTFYCPHQRNFVTEVRVEVRGNPVIATIVVLCVLYSFVFVYRIGLPIALY